MTIRAFPRSIRARLLLLGVILTGIAMLVATLLIDNGLDRVVRRGLEERLDVQIALLARSVRPDGSVDAAMLKDVDPFTQNRRGWGWRIVTPARTYTSEELVSLAEMRAEGGRGREGRFRAPPEILQSGRTEELYTRTLDKATATGIVRITTTAPLSVFYAMRNNTIMPVLMTMAGLSIVLLLAAIVQLQVGLRPLTRLKTALADVRAGTMDRIPSDQPSELAPVVTELNALLDENESALARARGHVSNLAHGLKTPLATLTIRLAEPGRDPDGELGLLVGKIDGAIRHHLGRARAASPGASGRPHVAIGTLVEDILDALRRIYSDKHIVMDSDIPATLAVGCDPHDLMEMLGNLLDNACKWTATRIAVTAQDGGKVVRIDIDDDGPGLSAAAIDQALVRGKRLDEREDGHGFGLPIARELAELHGGSLELGAAPTGGLRASLLLPRDNPRAMASAT